MKYCTQCVMPDTRPGLYFDKDGVCSACRAHEQKARTDWNARRTELEALCDKHRGKCGANAFDCIIAVSGGKDSHYQVHVFKEQMGMNPLLVSVEDNFTMTEAGKHNIRNISETFGCSIISIKPNLRAEKALARTCFAKWGRPTWYIDRLIYTYPIRMALAFRIPLVVYGENVSYEYGGEGIIETPSAMAQINNGAAPDIPVEGLVGEGVNQNDLYLCDFPSKELQSFQLEPVYLSYFVKWDSYSNYLFAKSVGFRDLAHEWRREHTFEWFDQVDSMGYLVHPWLKYPKFGHASATDYAARFVRYGLLTRNEAIELVKKHDHRLDQKALDDFCRFAGLSIRRFWEIADGLYNRDIFEKNRFGEWVLKSPLWEKQ